jgi:hypothetical protein
MHISDVMGWSVSSNSEYSNDPVEGRVGALDRPYTVQAAGTATGGALIGSYAIVGVPCISGRGGVVRWGEEDLEATALVSSWRVSAGHDLCLVATPRRMFGFVASGPDCGKMFMLVDRDWRRTQVDIDRRLVVGPAAQMKLYHETPRSALHLVGRVADLFGTSSDLVLAAFESACGVLRVAGGEFSEAHGLYSICNRSGVWHVVWRDGRIDVPALGWLVLGSGGASSEISGWGEGKCVIGAFGDFCYVVQGDGYVIQIKLD